MYNTIVTPTHNPKKEPVSATQISQVIELDKVAGLTLGDYGSTTEWDRPRLKDMK